VLIGFIYFQIRKESFSLTTNYVNSTTTFSVVKLFLDMLLRRMNSANLKCRTYHWEKATSDPEKTFEVHMNFENDGELNDSSDISQTASE